MLRMTKPVEPALVRETRVVSETEALAGALAGACPRGTVVYLSGELGSGKSTFARAWLRALGVAGPIKSPTYTLLESYALDNGLDAVHMDLYRIADADELDFLAMETFAENLAVMLVEWPEVGAARLPAADLWIHLAHGENTRRIRVDCPNSGLRAVVRGAGFHNMNES